MVRYRIRFLEYLRYSRLISPGKTFVGLFEVTKHAARRTHDQHELPAWVDSAAPC